MEEGTQEAAARPEEDGTPLLPCNANGAPLPPAAAAAPASGDASHPSKHAPFSRDDSFGALGRGPLPWYKTTLLLLACFTIVPLRFILLLLVLLLYYAICRISTLFRSPGEEEGQENYGHLRGSRRFVIVHSGRLLARVMLFVLGFYWIKVERVTSSECLDASAAPSPAAIVSNHVSYIDILYHMSASFPSFVAKRSVAKLPFVGLISKCLGCVYVQRESKTSDTKGVSGIVAERVRAAATGEQAQLMLLFPEGTTTNGNYLLPFKTGAFLSQAPLLPVILKYPYTRFSPAWESISGVRHIVLLLCQPVNYLEVKRLPVYCPSEKERSNPKLYADNVRSCMASAGGLTLSDSGLPEKRVYLEGLRNGDVSCTRT